MTEKQKLIFRKILENILYPLLSFGIVVSIWAITAKVKDNPLVLPMPGDVFVDFFNLYKEKNFLKAIGKTLSRTTISFAISFVIAYFASFSGAKFNPVHKVISPIVSFLRAAPTVAVILVLYVFVNIRSLSIIIGFLIAFPIMYSSFYTAMHGVDKNILLMLKVYKVNPIKVLFNVYFLSISDTVFDTSRATFSLTVKVVIAAEILTVTAASVGGKIYSQYLSFEISKLLAWTILAILLSFFVEIVITVLKKICIRWEK